MQNERYSDIARSIALYQRLTLAAAAVGFLLLGIIIGSAIGGRRAGATAAAGPITLKGMLVTLTLEQAHALAGKPLGTHLPAGKAGAP